MKSSNKIVIILAALLAFGCINEGGWYDNEKGNDIDNYMTVTIGEQVWMAENLNYNVTGSRCYGNRSVNCAQYGRLYDWRTAMALPSNCNSNKCSGIESKHRGICPQGWHIPNNTDWSILINYADSTGGSVKRNSPTAGRYLKAQAGWSSGGNGTDIYGFMALPAGYHALFDGSRDLGYSAGWWSATENEHDTFSAHYRYIYFNNASAYWGTQSKFGLKSIRCLKD